MQCLSVINKRHLLVLCVELSHINNGSRARGTVLVCYKESLSFEELWMMEFIEMKRQICK